MPTTNSPADPPETLRLTPEELRARYPEMNGAPATFSIEECTWPNPPDLAGCQTLDQVTAKLCRAYPDFFIYRGGSHVAIHAQDRPIKHRGHVVVEPTPDAQRSVLIVSKPLV